MTTDMTIGQVILKVAIVNILGGLMYGYAIGFVGVYDVFNNINTNCTHLETQEACGSVKFANCHWVKPMLNESATCLFEDLVQCDLLTESACKGNDKCAYNHDSELCEHVVGWSATKTGIFAGSMIVGGMIGSFVAPPFLRMLGRKRPIMIIGAVAVLSSILMSISRAADSYGLLIFARVLLGVCCGIACVVCPMYVNEMAPAVYKGPAGVTFQIFVTFGIVVAAFVGLVGQPTDFKKDLGMEARFQVFINIQTILSFFVVVMGYLIDESDGVEQAEESENLQVAENRGAGAVEHTWTSMAGQLLAAFFVALVLQMTGINAIMNYAPKITKAAGLAPLLGNFVVMLWNFVTTIVSIPVAKKFSMRGMFITGTIVASAACLITGIPVYPGVVASDDAKHVLVGIGILIFIAAFEITIGPTFYVLAQDLFPKSFREKGSSFTVVVQFVFNIIINVFFPIAVQGLSGGKSGNQNKGMGIVFMFFGACGFLSLTVLFKKLKTYEEGASDYVEIK